MPPKRFAYTNTEKLALRQHHQANPRLTQKELATWFEGEYNKPIKQVSVSEVLGLRYSYLDDSLQAEGARQPARKRQRKEHYPELEEALAQYVASKQSKGGITGDIIKTRAVWYWQRLPQYQGLPQPAFSNGWLAGFKARHGIKEYKRHGESGSIDEAEVMAAIALIQARIAQYPLDDQYNCDETGLYYKRVPDRTLATSQIAGLKVDKARLSIHHCTNASGSHKLSPWIIGRFKRPRCFNAAGVDVARLDCVYRANAKSWMTGVVMVEWLRWFDKQMNGRKVILLMDNFSVYEKAVNEL